MNFLANKIAVSIKNANPDQTASIEVMRYALEILLNTLFIVLMSGLIGILLGTAGETLLFLGSFIVLRLCSGGFHLRTAAACNFATIALSTILPYAIEPNGTWAFALTLISGFILLWFAPNPDPHSQIPKRLYTPLKIASLLLICIILVVPSSVIALAFFVQALTVIPWQRRVVS